MGFFALSVQRLARRRSGVGHPLEQAGGFTSCSRSLHNLFLFFAEVFRYSDKKCDNDKKSK
jgi:hypothetical protein